MLEVAGCGDAGPPVPCVGFSGKVESLWVCVTCLEVNVNKDAVVLWQLRHAAFWLWESREGIMGVTPMSYAGLYIIFTVEQGS